MSILDSALSQFTSSKRIKGAKDLLGNACEGQRGEGAGVSGMTLQAVTQDFLPGREERTEERVYMKGLRLPCHLRKPHPHQRDIQNKECD